MYSAKLERLLKSAGASIGDRVTVTKDGHNYSGTVLQRPDLGDGDALVIKLDNGYNIGLRPEALTVEKPAAHLGMGKTKAPTVAFRPDKPAIALIASGGTIASRVDYGTGGVSAIEDPREFLFNVPELADTVNIRNLVKPFTKMSEDMDHTDWIALAKAAAKELAGGEGVIITHGTDTLHYTAAALSFMLPSLPKPVILLGAQKSSDRGSSDAGMNLVCAAHAAISDIAEVAVCMHGTMNDDHCLLIRGTKARKMHTVRRDAFRPVNDTPLAKIWPSGKIDKINRQARKRSDGEVVLDIKFEPKVAIVKAYPGSDPTVIDYLVSKGYKGFVIEAMGLGHVPTFAGRSWIETIKRHTKDGIPFVTTSQTIYGRINADVYTNLRMLYHGANAIPGEDMLTETAYVKLGWVLGHSADQAQVRKMMLTSVAGEISERSRSDTFLA
ncbi:MAG: Glu-tRNA(Gln) amidotransferase subunit GatD [Candidatus Aenigmarchaeota archaeon]|nr:Glu-tRNA(Gln) amidotransferase subunit GatD [Candidatus Aenigmarchaeota archaeon]